VRFFPKNWKNTPLFSTLICNPLKRQQKQLPLFLLFFLIHDTHPVLLYFNEMPMNAFIQLFMNPAIISLGIGILCGLYSSLSFPRILMQAISTYLIFTIGFKGGSCLGVGHECTPPLIMLTLLGALIGCIQPFINYYILKKTTAVDKETAAVIASEYGSISIITFITALNFLTEHSIPYDTFMSATAGILELPGLFSGLLILKKIQKRGDQSLYQSLIRICKAIISCKQISSIFIGFLAGFLLRSYDITQLNSTIIWPFNLLLIFFMIDIGIKIAQQKSSLHLFSPSLIAFALYMPIINGSIGIVIGSHIVTTTGTLFLFAILLSSASYIAVPAIMRGQTKTAKEAIYLPLSLGITLPFNILIGIPLYYYLASYMLSLSA